MDSTRRLSTKQRSFVVGNIVLGAVLLSTAALSSSGGRNRQEDRMPILKDNTGSFNLISVEKIHRMFVMQVQNTSNKTITAYGTSFCDVPESATDYTIGEYSIQPGAVVEMTISIRSMSDKCGSEINQPTMTIMAVIFDDRTYAGEAQWVQGMLEDRRGNKIQLKRINKLLKKAQKWSDADEPAALERLKGQIASLSVDEGEAPAVRGGLSEAKQRTLYLLNELKQWHQSSLTTQSRVNIPIQGELSGINSLREGMDKLISLYEKWISRY